MAKNLKPGDAVIWKSSGGDAQGEVVKKITTPTHIKGHKALHRRIIQSSLSRRTRGNALRISHRRCGSAERAQGWLRRSRLGTQTLG